MSITVTIPFPDVKKHVNNIRESTAKFIAPSSSTIHLPNTNINHVTPPIVSHTAVKPTVPIASKAESTLGELAHAHWGKIGGLAAAGLAVGGLAGYALKGKSNQ